MLTRFWRLFVVILAVGIFGGFAASTAAAQDTVTKQVRVTATVPGGGGLELCIDTTCVPVAPGGTTVEGILTVSVTAPDTSGTTLTPSGCGTTAGQKIIIQGATTGGTISAKFTGTVTPPGGPGTVVDQTVTAPSVNRTVEASVCVS